LTIQKLLKRVVVLTAVDERMLKLAISNKYVDLISKGFDTQDQKKLSTTILVREYMDKLFISGIKLKNLTADEKKEVLYSLTKGKVNIDSESSSQIDLDSLFGYRKAQSDNQHVHTVSKTNELVEFIKSDNDFELEDFEYKFLTDIIEQEMIATPRNIRIIYYRYLLAKRFMSYRLSAKPQLTSEWNVNCDKSILPHLIVYYGSVRSPEDMYGEHSGALKTDENQIKVPIFGNEFVLNKNLFLELLQIIDIVVPY